MVVYIRFLLKVNAYENYGASTFHFCYISIHLYEDNFVKFFAKQSAPCIL